MIINVRTIFLFVISITILPGCTMPYVIDRTHDALDIVTVTGGLGFGANARFGPVSSPSIITQVNYVGIEGGDPFFGFGWEESGSEFHGSVFSYIINGWEIGNLTERTKLRHKFYKAMYIFGMSTNRGLIDEPQYNYPYFTQIEAVVGVGPAIKLGFNPGELIDFVLGLIIIDIYNDDIKKQRCKNRTGQETQSDSEGELNDSKIKPIYDTSRRNEAQPIIITASCYFPPSDPTDPNHIDSVEYVVIPLKQDQDEISHAPEGGFGLPEVSP